jgi:CheY-like chemotaxis protein
MSDAVIEGPVPFRNFGSGLSGCYVLVIENDTDNRDMFSVFLRSCGAKVATAETAKAALKHLSARRINAIVTDLSAVKDTGLSSFLDGIRGMPHHSHTPIIAVTGWSRRDVPELAQFTAFMQKPVDLDNLATIIRQLVVAA